MLIRKIQHLGFLKRIKTIFRFEEAEFLRLLAYQKRLNCIDDREYQLFLQDYVGSGAMKKFVINDNFDVEEESNTRELVKSDTNNSTTSSQLTSEMQ